MPIDPDLSLRLLEQAPDAMIFAGTDGMIVAWNAAAADLFGHSADEAVGQSLDLIVPERFRDQHWAGYDRALEAGETKYRGQALPTRSMRKDGTSIYVELSFAIVKDEAGTVIGSLAHARDISERFQRERDQRARIRELEAQLAERPAGG